MPPGVCGPRFAMWISPGTRTGGPGRRREHGIAFWIYWGQGRPAIRPVGNGSAVAMKRAVHLITFLVTLLLGGLAATAVPAQEIYRWVDENGVVNFSDTAPAARSRSVSTVAVEDTRSSDYDPEADIYNVEAQAERMQALREPPPRWRSVP